MVTTHRSTRIMPRKACVPLLIALSLWNSSYAAQAPTEDSLWYYEIGGAEPVSAPANPSVVSVTLGGSAQLGLGYSCGKFDPVAAVTHTLNDIGAGVDNMMNSMTAAASAGAGMLNDVRALSRNGALEAAAGTGLPVCLMHMQGEPRTMQHAPQYDDVVADIMDYLCARVASCESSGIVRSRLLLDPGFGFGKTLEHNLALLAGLREFGRLGLPVLVGISRKSMLGALTGREVEDRLAASVAAALMAVERGAAIVRVHDVAPTVDALKVWQAVVSRQAGGAGRM